jgi:hypothetical protein
MQTTRIALLAGVAAMALAGLTGIAEAGSPETHVLTLRVPDGQVEQVRYMGDVPPTVVLTPAATAALAAPPDSFAADSFAADSFAADPFAADPFAMFEQISPALDRQETAMFRIINAMAEPNGTGFATIPVLAGPGVCSRSVQITFGGNGQAPRIVSRPFGDCGVAHGKPAPVMLPNAPARKPAPDIVQAQAAKPYLALVHHVGDWQVGGWEH